MATLDRQIPSPDTFLCEPWSSFVSAAKLRFVDCKFARRVALLFLRTKVGKCVVQLSVIELSKLLHHAGCLSERSKVTVIILLRNAILMCCFNSRAQMRASKAIGYRSEFVSLSRAVMLSPNCPAVSLLALTAPLDLGSQRRR